MLAPWKKSYDNLESILKSRSITLPTNVRTVKTMYRCESWTIKKAEHWRIDAFKMWCWRRLLRVAWRTKRSNQSILKEINPEYLLEWLMLKLQYFSHLMWRANSLEKTLMLGKTVGRRRRGWQKMRCLDGFMAQWTWVWMSSRREWRKSSVLQSMGLHRVRHGWGTEQQHSYNECLKFICRVLLHCHH